MGMSYEEMRARFIADWKYFKPEEVLGVDGMNAFKRGICLVRPELMVLLRDLREYLDCPVVVNTGELKCRGYRSLKEHKEVYRRYLQNPPMHSQHLYGCAVDFHCPERVISWVYEKVIDFNRVRRAERKPVFTGIGRYSTFVHVDIRHKLDGTTTYWTN